MSDYDKGFDDGYKEGKESRQDISDGSMFQLANLKEKLDIAVEALEKVKRSFEVNVFDAKAVIEDWEDDHLIITQALLKIKGEK